jgi:hypothetical protein
MFHYRDWISVSVVILGFAIFIPVAHAQRQDFKSNQCSTNTFSVVHFTPELRILSYDQKSTMQSTHESKLFDNWTKHSVYVLKLIDGRMSWNGVAKAQAPDGEFIIWEFYGDSQSGTTTKVIYGTGKWKGVKGESKNRRISTEISVAPNTEQFCEEVVGWIELPK